jgi:hypothetical protein
VAVDEAVKTVVEAVDEFDKFADICKFLAAKAPDLNLKALREKISGRFKVLVMIDLGGSIFLRLHWKEYFKRKPDFFTRNKKYFFRPGFKQLLRRLASHPRCQLSFYSSIMGNNV